MRKSIKLLIFGIALCIGAMLAATLELFLYFDEPLTMLNHNIPPWLSFYNSVLGFIQIVGVIIFIIAIIKIVIERNTKATKVRIARTVK